MSSIEEFVDVRNSQNLKFDDIWRIYDYQFNVLRDFMIHLGDKYEVEVFTGSSSKVLNLSHRYSSKQVFVYINEVIQWKDDDYEETASNKITLLHDRKTSDVIRVVIMRSNVLQADITDYANAVKKLYEEYSEQLEKLKDYSSRITEIEETLGSSQNIDKIDIDKNNILSDPRERNTVIDIVYEHDDRIKELEEIADVSRKQSLSYDKSKEELQIII